MAFINKYTIGALITVLVVSFIWTYGRVQYNKGYEERGLKAQIELSELKFELEMKKSAEINRQITTNRLAQENSRKQILQMQVEKDQLEKLLEDAENEARKEPNRDRIGLDASSVMRINKIK